MKMGLEEILKPIKYVDGQVIKSYTKLGKKLNLDIGKRRYWAGFLFNTFGTDTSLKPVKKLVNHAFKTAFFYSISLIDCVYNYGGIIRFHEHIPQNSEERTIL